MKMGHFSKDSSLITNLFVLFVLYIIPNSIALLTCLVAGVHPVSADPRLYADRPEGGASRRSRSTLPGEKGGARPRRRHATGKAAKAESKTMYLQKSLLGGILIFEIGVCEPFFYTKLMRWRPRGSS